VFCLPPFTNLSSVPGKVQSPTANSRPHNPPRASQLPYDRVAFSSSLPRDFPTRQSGQGCVRLPPARSLVRPPPAPSAAPSAPPPRSVRLVPPGISRLALVPPLRLVAHTQCPQSPQNPHIPPSLGPRIRPNTHITVVLGPEHNVFASLTQSSLAPPPPPRSLAPLVRRPA
jgi:hypothetical protein